MAEGNGVDIVISPNSPLPFEDDSVDIIVTSSCFEHDVFFWETYLDCIRILKDGGLLYINAPGNGPFHQFPLDCWRFYPDAGIALRNLARRHGYQVDLVESFIAFPGDDIPFPDSEWHDFVAVFCKGSFADINRKGRLADREGAVNIYDIVIAREDILENHNMLLYNKDKNRNLERAMVDIERDHLFKEMETLIVKQNSFIKKMADRINELDEIIKNNNLSAPDFGRP